MDVQLSQRLSSPSAPVPPPNITDEPPPYKNAHAQDHIPQDLTEHTFLLKENSRNWVTLKLYSDAKSPKSLPLYFEGEGIVGSLAINAEKGDSVHSITAKVVGRIIVGGHVNGSLTFLDQSLSIWAKSIEIPRVSSLSQGVSGSKLLGYCKWQLCIPLPRDVIVPWPTGTTQIYRLPETFLERHINASVVYHLSILIRRGRLRSDRRIDTAFAYVPRIKPEPSSLPRQLAYTERSPLPGPESDREGWKTLMPVIVGGVLLPNHPVNIQCTVSLAKPLCYTRGTLIPCALKLECRDKNVLNMFAEPAAVALCLRRRIKFHSVPSAFDGTEDEYVGEMGTAIWWPSPNFSHDSSPRYLEGEIKLTEGLRPTCTICHFSISYFVVLCTFKVPYYLPDTPDLLSEEVKVATTYADGPRPHAYSDAPALNPSAQRSEVYIAPEVRSSMSRLGGLF